MTKRMLALAATGALLGLAGVTPAYAQDEEDCTPKRDNGNAPAKLSFCGTNGGEAHWQHDESDSPNDDNLQDIEMVTTPAPPLGTGGTARIDVMHVFGTPTASYPNSSY